VRSCWPNKLRGTSRQANLRCAQSIPSTVCTRTNLLSLVEQEASRAIREALALAPKNEAVKEAFVRIQSDETSQPLLKLCREFAQEKNITSGREALRYLNGGGPNVSSQVAEKCFKHALEAEKSDPGVRDELVASLIAHCLDARCLVANKLQGSVSLTFEELFAIGDGAANGITVVSLNAVAWPNENVRRSIEKDVFLLFLAKLLESGHDNDGRALKGISRHLAVDAERLHEQVDEESFDSILVCLDYRLSQEIRGQATLSTAKYLEASKEVGEEYLKRFIMSRTAKHATEDLVLAFSAAAAVFPIATPLVASLFLVEGFLPSLVPLLDKKSRPIKVEKAALDMLSAACVDSACREAISKYCWDWIHHVMEDEEDERHGQAALILAKVQSQPTSMEQSKDVNRISRSRKQSKSIADVVPTLKGMLFSDGDVDKRTGVEGLAYASQQPLVKDEIIRDSGLIGKLLELPKKDSLAPQTAFGFLTLLDNLTRYLPNLSEEQRKMSELKAYAAASRPQVKPHPLDEDDNVTARCQRLLEASLVSYLVTLKASAVSHQLSPTSLAIIAKILLSLARTPTSRGILAQQGAIPLLLQIHATTTVVPTGKNTAAHALARILISTNPSLIPSYTSSCVPPLLTLLDPSALTPSDSDAARDLLPTFEALLALTNLVSDPSLKTGEAVVMAAYSTVEDLLLHGNTLLQRAATELICNLAAGPPGLEKLADGSPAAGKRLHVLLALADAEDVATRQAAGGALAAATEFEGAVKQTLERQGGVERVFGMCKDEDAGCRHRGAVVLRNLITCEGQSGVDARKIVRQKDGTHTLAEMIKGEQPPLMQLAAESLQALRI
jgi:hypothetical protein